MKVIDNIKYNLKFKKNKSNKDNIVAYIMMAPMLIGFVAFTLYPIFYILRWAWFDFDGVFEYTFIGVENFIRAFSRDEAFWKSILNTLYITFIGGAIEIPIALVLAVFINSKAKINSVFRTSYFLPSIISISIVGLIFSILFDAYNGIINQILLNFNIIDFNISWFSTKWLALTVIILASVWSHFGVNMIFFLMGLQSIPAELYECADIDGAGPVQKFRYITIPMLAPILQTIIMLGIVHGMKMTEMVLVLTGGQPAGETEVVMTYIFKFFFTYGDSITRKLQYGYASALSIITAIIIGIITILYLKLTKKMNQTF